MNDDLLGVRSQRWNDMFSGTEAAACLSHHVVSESAQVAGE